MKNTSEKQGRRQSLASCLQKMQMSPEEQAFLQSHLQSRTRYLEIGAGYSTPWFSQSVRRMVSIETRQGWYEQVRGLLVDLEITNVELRHLPPEACAYNDQGEEKWTCPERMDYGRTEEFAGYLRGIEAALDEEEFDVVLVDGNVRHQVIEMLVRRQFGGIILLHDVEPARARMNAPIFRNENVKLIKQVGTLAELAAAPFRVEVGGCRYVPGWVTLDQGRLDVTCRSDWEKHFRVGDIRCLFAEHMLEHLPADRVRDFFETAHPYLCEEGTIRMAVPDAMHPSTWYHELCKPNGLDVGSDDHKSFFSARNIPQTFCSEQYELRLLEWWDENGFHKVAWHNDEDHGKVIRSSRFYNGRITQSAQLRSLLYQTTPERLRGEYEKYDITYTSLIFDLKKKTSRPACTLAPQYRDPQPASAVNKIIGFCVSRQPVMFEFPFRRHFPWLRFESHSIKGWQVHLWGHGDFSPFIQSDKGFIVIGYTQQELKRLGTRRLENRGVFLRIGTERVELENDLVGAFRVFYGSGNDNICIASQEELVLQGVGRREVDPTNLLQYLLLGHLTGEHTLYPHVRTMQANSSLSWDENGFTAQDLEPIDCQHSENPVDALFEITRATIEAYSEGYPRLFLPLSGGYDSRLIAACLNQPDRVTAATYDYSYPLESGYEVARARAIAAAAGIRNWQPFDLGADYAADFSRQWYDLFGTSHHQHGMYVLSFYHQMFRGLQGPMPTLSGYIGDAFVGHQLNVFEQCRDQNAAAKFYESQYRGAMGFAVAELSRLLNYDFTSLLPEVTGRWERMWEACEGQDHQKFILNLARHRGRSHVSYLCTIADFYGAAVTPFIDRQYIQAVLGLPYEQLRGRRAQEQMIQKHLPTFWLDESKMPPYKHAVNFLCMQKRKQENIFPVVVDGKLLPNRYFREEGVEALLSEFNRACESPNVLYSPKPIQSFFKLNTLQPLYYLQYLERRDGQSQPAGVRSAVVAADQPSHYNEDYFAWQRSIGRFGGMANRFKFEAFIRPEHTVLDFGCGGGYLLEGLPCREKIGIEINEAARREAQASGLRVCASAEEVRDASVDVIISNHALEHVESPGTVLKTLYRKLKPGGRIVFVVPHQDTRQEYDPADKNKHLYTWNQLTLGNLFEHAGFQVEKVEAIQHQWPPQYEEIYQKHGEQEFHRICRDYARQNQNYQIRIAAAKACAVSKAAAASPVPTVLITYNRPLHTAQVLQSLKEHNVQNLIIFSDAPRTFDQTTAVSETRQLLEAIDWTRPELIYREQNLGLARSIVSAVNYVFEKHERLILLEDDCVPQPFFYDHMLTCLERYADHPDIYGISGHSVQLPEELLAEYPYDVYFSPRIGSWGWATWKRAWAHYGTDLAKLIADANAAGVDLACGGRDIPVNLERYLKGELKDVWTLHWVLSVYNRRGAFIYPTQSHIRNIGLDGTGVHCGQTTRYESPCARTGPVRFPEKAIYHGGILKHVQGCFHAPEARCMQSMAFLRTVQKKKPPLKILQVNTLDNRGGAAKVAWRIQEELKTRGCRTAMYVKSKGSLDPDVVEVTDAQMDSGTDFKKKGFLDYDIQSTFVIPSRKEFQEADLVHFHNLHGGYFNLKALPELTRLKPCVWTLHDMQALTGHCAHSFKCDRWQTGCGNCPDLTVYPEVSVDQTDRLIQDKQMIYDHSCLQIVVPADWLRKKVQQSILRNHPVELIYNGCDTEMFRPLDKVAIRRQLGIPQQAFVIGGSAQSGVLANVWKGGPWTLAVLDRLKKQIPNLLFLNVGAAEKSTDPFIVNVPPIREESQLARLYNALDVFLYTPVADTCPLVVIEALACGIPIVTCETGGIPELVRNKRDGFVFRQGEVADLAHAVRALYDNRNLRQTMGVHARQAALERFTLEQMTDCYLELYHRCIDRHTRLMRTAKRFDPAVCPR